AACDLTLEAPAHTAVTVLGRALQQAPAAHRPLLVETLHQVMRKAPALPAPAAHVTRMLEVYLADPALSPLQRAHLAEVYGDLLPAPRRRVDLKVLESLSYDPEPAVQLAARLHLRRFEVNGDPGDFDEMIATALARSDAAARHVALHALSK